MMTQTMGNIGCLVCNTALGQTGKLYQRQVDKWISTNGKEWTCIRTKAIWSAALSLRNGTPEHARRIYQENSISYHSDSMLPKGAAKNVVKSFVNSRQPAAVKRCAAVLRVYTSIRLKTPSKRQINKALSNITGPSTANRKYIGSSLQEEVRLALEGRVGFNYAKQFLSRPLGRNEIHAEHLKSTSVYYSRNRVPKELRGEPYSSMAMSLLTEPYIPESLDQFVPCLEMRLHDRSIGWDFDRTSSDEHAVRSPHTQKYVGKITLLQEQGAKARVVAMPSAWVQLAFMPWHNRLAQTVDILYNLESCVSDQRRGVEVALNHCNNGGKVACTDLSAATDRFPIQTSLHIARLLGLDDYSTAMEDIVAKPFKCDFSNDNHVYYGVGQPMGLYSSFPLFHLSNCIIADVATRRVTNPDKFPSGVTFQVLGDDIIFSDTRISSHYQDIMHELGVNISQEKSYEGNLFEFAGFIGFKTNKGWFSMRPYKVPDAKYITNPISFLDSLGVKVKDISPKWRSMYDDYRRTVSSRELDLVPILPSWEDKAIPDARGDNRTLVNLSLGIQMYADEYGYTTPTMSTDPVTGRPTTRINAVPLFRERGMLDFYQYDRDFLIKKEKDNPFRAASNSFNKDPLIKEVRSGRCERLLQTSTTTSKVLEGTISSVPTSAPSNTVPKKLVTDKEKVVVIQPVESSPPQRVMNVNEVKSTRSVKTVEKSYGPKTLALLEMASTLGQSSWDDEFTIE